jgi:protocatechuate 3,4-dioxygenase beta subunit
VSVLPTAGGTPVGKATTSATNGRYSVKGVSPGTYAVKFKRTWLAGGRAVRANGPPLSARGRVEHSVWDLSGRVISRR